MVTGLWNKIEIYCGLHEEPVEMKLTERRNTVFYECPKSISTDSSYDASLCHNSLPLKDFEKMLDHISKVLYEAEVNNEVPNLKNESFTLGKFLYKIFEHDDKIKIIVRDVRVKK